MSKVEVICKNCNKEFMKYQSQVIKSPNHFCSRSCANSFNNKNPNRKHGPKRTKFKYCQNCGILIPNKQTWCDKHKLFYTTNYCSCGKKISKNSKACPDHKIIKIPVSNKTIKESEDTTGKPANKFRAIRDNARIIAKRAGLLNKCSICGYDKHVVTCHIKEISSFDKNTPISEVNDISNLLGLCKNHHWELDHGLLSKEDKKKLNL